MSKRIIALITLVSVSALCMAGCGDKTAETSAAETSAAATTVVESAEQTAAETAAETTVEETAAETSSENADGIPQPGDTYNGHTVEHTEDQPNCDDGSHGTIWIFYTDSSDIDYIEY